LVDRTSSGLLGKGVSGEVRAAGYKGDDEDMALTLVQKSVKIYDKEEHKTDTARLNRLIELRCEIQALRELGTRRFLPTYYGHSKPLYRIFIPTEFCGVIGQVHATTLMRISGTVVVMAALDISTNHLYMFMSHLPGERLDKVLPRFYTTLSLLSRHEFVIGW
jgi:hypothetical protein